MKRGSGIDVTDKMVRDKRTDTERFLDNLERYREDQELIAMGGNRCGHRQIQALRFYDRPVTKQHTSRNRP